MSRPNVLLSILVLMSVAAMPAPAAGSDVTPHWYRNTAISPDGATVAFTHGGDLYRVGVEGGRAIPLTLDEAWDGDPVWSPDGRFIAFASDRHGGKDVFLMPSEGGTATRLTFHSRDDVPSAFSADGREVYFSSVRLDDPRNAQFPSRGLGELYAVSVEGGTPRQVLTTPAERAVPGARGRRLLYEDVKGYEDPLRKHHTSAVTRDIWVVDLATGQHTRLTDFGGEDRDPDWVPGKDAFYFLSERNGDMNVFEQAVEAGAAPTQRTRFEHHPVRDLSVSSTGDLAFSWHGDLYHLAPGGEEPRRIDVTIGVDRQQPPVTMEQVRRGVTEFAVSPDGQEVAFVTRGELFVTSVDFATTRRITDTPEQERSVSFSPDGRKLLYAGERDGSWNVYESRIEDDEEEWFFAATRIVETPVAATGQEEFQPRYSKSGEEVAYLTERVILTVKNLETGKTRTVVPGKFNYSYSDGDQWFDWSPDGARFAVQFLSRGRYYANAVGIVSAEGGSDPVDITNSGYDNSGPRFAMDGGLVIWTTERYGQKNHGSWGGETDVVGAFLDRETYDAFRKTKEQRKLAKGREPNVDADAKDEAEEVPAEEADDAADDTPRTIDWAGIEDRTLRMTIHSSDLADFALTPDGRALLYLARFENGYDLWIHDFVEESTKLAVKLGADRAALELDDGGKAVFVLADGELSKIAVKSGDDGTEAGKRESIATAPEMNVRPDAERAYLLDHVWRQVQQKFYDPDLHGVDWAFYRDQYEPKLAGITNNRDFAELLSELLGELNGSHTGGRYRPRDDGGERSPSLGVFFDGDHEGPGLRIAEILPRGPLADAELGVEVGMTIVAVDGVELAGRTNLWALLNNKEGQRVRLRLEPESGDPIERVVVPFGAGEEYGLLYDRWVVRRREQVRELSGGKIGYVHVRGMNDRSFRTTYSEVLGRNFDTEAVIVDTRFNGGGWLHDDLVVLLGGKRYVDFMPRNQAVPGQRFYGEPGRRWWKPSAVVMSESNYSDAHFFPWAYTEVGLGPTIGMPVPGTSTAVWWERLHTGDLVFGIPQVGAVDIEDGGYLENRQLEPDYRVAITPEQAAAGEDPQIEKAVEVLMQAVEANRDTRE